MSRHTRFGDLTPDLSRSTTEALPGGLVLRHTPFYWWPRARIARDLPPDFRVELQCFSVEGRASSRRLALLHASRPPEARVRDVVPPNAFLVPSVKAGEVIRCRRSGLGDRRRDEYRLSQFLFQVGPRLQEHLARRFERVDDLANTGQRATRRAANHVLPPTLGCDVHGTGRRWSLTRLLEEGRSAAEAAGEALPIPEAVAIRFGLLVAARRAPLDPGTIDRSGATALVRSALFDHGRYRDPIPAAVRRRIRDRFVDVFVRHIDDTGPDFAAFFFERFTDIECQIARRRSAGGPIDRAVVRQGMLDLVFRAYLDAALCHDTFMAEFARGLSPPLDAAERKHFAAANRSRTELGGLPLDFLRQHFHFLREGVCDVWDAPTDPVAWGVLLRLLDFYATLSQLKRQSDRDYGRTRSHRNRDGRTALTRSLPDGDSMVRPQAVAEFEEVAQELREQRGARCACGSFHDWRAHVDEEACSPTKIVYDDGCGGCGHSERREVSRAEFVRVHGSIFRNE